MRKLLLMLVAIIAMIGVVLLSPVQANSNQRLSDAERKDCAAKGGRAAIFGLSGVEGCVLPMADAGKQCIDGSQCDGNTCLLDDKKTGFKPPSPGERVVGQCAPTNFGFGCAWRVNNGEAIGMLCVD